MMKGFLLFLFLGFSFFIKSMDVIDDQGVEEGPTDYILKIVREASRKKWGTIFLHGYVHHKRIRQLALDRDLTDGYTKNCFVDGHIKRENLDSVRTYITFFCSQGVRKHALLLTYLQARGKKNIALLEKRLGNLFDESTDCVVVSSNLNSKHNEHQRMYACTTLLKFDKFVEKVARQ